MFKREIQICIFPKNQPGRFAEVCDLLFAHGVDIRAMNVTPTADFGVIRMVVDDAKKAKTALEREKVPFIENEVLSAEVTNQQGVAATLGRKLAEAGINIEYSYFSSGDPGSSALMIFMVSDLERALRVLG
jgi:hypothetical protein